MSAIRREHNVRTTPYELSAQSYFVGLSHVGTCKEIANG